MKMTINIATQQLLFTNEQGEKETYAVSTGKAGSGQQFGSYQTPLGRHVVCEKIGEELPENAVFVHRQWTQEVYSPELAEQAPDRDWILTRILRLDGCEPGFNQGGDVDTLKRCVYIHGTPDSEPMGIPRSHGCIRMRNQDIIRLFEQVQINTAVEIVQ